MVSTGGIGNATATHVWDAMAKLQSKSALNIEAAVWGLSSLGMVPTDVVTKRSKQSKETVNVAKGHGAPASGWGAREFQDFLNIRQDCRATMTRIPKPILMP